MDNLERSINLPCMFMECEWKLEYSQKKTRQARGEYAKFTHKGRDFKPRRLNCEADVLISHPPSRNMTQLFVNNRQRSFLLPLHLGYNWLLLLISHL